MEKQEAKFNVPGNIIVEIGENKVQVKPFLSLAEQTSLISAYIDIYFHTENRKIPDDRYDVIDAEFSLELSIIDLCTSISMEDSFENVIYSETWDVIKEKIINYWEFRGLLDKVVRNVEKQIAETKSIGGIIDGLYSKVEEIINQLLESAKNITPEDLERLKETGKELVNKIAESPVAEIFKDMEKK